MAGTSTGFLFDAKGLEAAGVVMNPKRMKFAAFFSDDGVQQLIGQSMKDRFDSKGYGSWAISPQWAETKRLAGLDPRPNIMTGRLMAAMTSPVDPGLSTGFSFSDGIALREVSEKELKWGVNKDHADFQSDGGTYPEKVSLKNPYAIMSEGLQNKMAEKALEYIIDLMVRRA